MRKILFYITIIFKLKWFVQESYFELTSGNISNQIKTKQTYNECEKYSGKIYFLGEEIKLKEKYYEN